MGTEERNESHVVCTERLGKDPSTRKCMFGTRGTSMNFTDGKEIC